MANEILRKLGSTSTATITLANLAAAAGRISTQIDLGALFAARYRIRLKCQFTSAPVEGGLFEVWLATSDNTLRDGALGAADAALSPVTLRFATEKIGDLYCHAITTVQEDSWPWEATSRYVTLVVYNGASTALDATAGHHSLTMDPIIDEVQ